MSEFNCPHCGKVITVSAGLDSAVRAAEAKGYEDTVWNKEHAAGKPSELRRNPFVTGSPEYYAWNRGYRRAV